MSPCQSYFDILYARGYRITSQRKMIVEAIAHSRDHVHAEEVYIQIKKRNPSVNLATVYRTLELLVTEGLASRIDLGEGRVSYATSQHGPHIHLVCRHCGEVVDAEQTLLLSLNKQLEAGYKFAPDLQHVSVLGLCSNCQSEISR